MKKKKDPMHLSRENLISSCITIVLDQLRPKEIMPHDGDRDKIKSTIQPMIEHALSMPVGLAEMGTPQWMQEKIKSGDYTYIDCTRFPGLMDNFIDKMMAQGDKRGFPVLRPGA